MRELNFIGRVFYLMGKMGARRIYYFEKFRTNIYGYIIFSSILTISPIYYEFIWSKEIKFYKVKKLLIYILEGNIYLIVISIPILLAFSYFIYREQQSISLRNENFYFIFIYLTFTIPSLILSVLFILKLKAPTIFLLEYLNFSICTFLFILLLSLISFCLLIRIYFRLFRVLLIDHHSSESGDKIKKYIKALYFLEENKNTRISDYYFNKVHNLIESKFQTLEFLMKNKMDKIFHDELNKISDLLFIIMEDTPKDNGSSSTYAGRLTQKYNIQFKNLYNIIVKNISELIISSSKYYTKTESKKVLEIMREIEPNKVTELYPGYLQGIEELSIKTISINDNLFEMVLSFLETMIGVPKNNKGDHYNHHNIDSIALGVLLIYQSLLKEAIEKNNVRLTTELTYSINKFVLEISKNNNLSLENDYETLRRKMQKSIESSLTSYMNQELFKEISLFILFQGALKSVELGNYNVTGLLIKRIPTDFDGEMINKVFEKFNENKGNIKKAYKLFDNEYEFNDLITNFNFNISSYDYCIQKLLFLLLGQELYIIEKNILFTKFSVNKNKLEFIPKEYFNKEYLDYIVTKISAVGNKYGLAFVNEELMIDKIISYIQPKKDNGLIEQL